MRLLVVALLIMSSVAFAEDSPALPSLDVQESVPTTEDNTTSHTEPEVKTQNADENTNPGVSSVEPQPSTEQSNAAGKTFDPNTVEQQNVAREGNVISRETNSIYRKGNRIQQRLVRVGWFAVGTQAMLTLVQLYFIWIANKNAGAAAGFAEKSADAARKSVEVADRGLKVSERAYLAVEKWQMNILYKGGPLSLVGVILNTGRTPATLAEYDLLADLRKDLPPLLDYSQLPKADLKDIPLGAERDVSLQAPAPVIHITPELVGKILDNPALAHLKLSPEQRENILKGFATVPQLPPEVTEGVINAGLMTLYVYGCFSYADVFDLPHRVAFCVRYDPKQGIFIVCNDRKYNYST